MQTLQLVRRLVRHGTLPQLAAFEAVVCLGSVTRAAERLHMAQPTVSGHLRKLSESVGEPLLLQQDRRQVPTAAGLALLDAARDIFAALQRAEHTLAAIRADATCADGADALQSTRAGVWTGLRQHEATHGPAHRPVVAALQEAHP
jgi:DNA-binding transcriptional LysR family regulator